MKRPIALLSNLLDDVLRLEPGAKHLDRDLKTIEARFEHEGYGFLTVTLPILCDAIDNGIKVKRFVCPSNFSKVKGGALPKLFSGLLYDVFDPNTGLLKDKPNIGMLKCLREILRLFKKLPWSDDRDVKLDHQARRSFRQCDESIASVIFDARHVHHMAGVCKLVLNQLEGADYETLAYKHGPGAVYEKLYSNQKWSEVHRSIGSNYQKVWDPLLDLLGCGDTSHVDMESGENPPVSNCKAHRGLERLFAADQLSYTLPDDQGLGSVPQIRNGDRNLHCERVARHPTHNPQEYPSSKARLLTVPKTSTARRTITAEPCLRQYAQQGLNRLLRDNILKCSVLNNSLDLTDQSESQRLALEGSRTGEWATIDLSSASDLMSIELVKVVFRDKPIFLERLMDSRSPEVEDGKHLYTLRKFAGMGNATTFPVQSVCFAVIAISAILDEWGIKPTMRTVRRAARVVRVYGDDIIVPTRYAHRVVAWIESFGLRVNHQKSFFEETAGQPCFREACGVDAYGGYDITPLYLRTVPETSSVEPSAIASLVATSNLMWDRCLYKASAYLSELVESILKRKLPLVPKRSSALGWHSRVDACNPTKWDPEKQRLCFKAPVLSQVYRPDALDGYAALLKFYSVPLLGRGAKHLERSPIRFRNRLRWRWMPAECW